jgi:ABC-type uncharacterized transport system fused permease/ATPase subunit
MLFRIIKMTKQAHEASRDPEGFAFKQATSAILGALIPTIITLLAFLGFLFALSYTSFWGGPYGLARFFFWFLVFIYGIGGYVLYFAWSKTTQFLKTYIKSARKKNTTAQEPQSHYREAEVIDEE